MTCLLMIKDRNNHVWLGSDRMVTRVVKWVDGKTREIHSSMYTHKSTFKNGVLIGGSGYALFCDYVINRLNFSTPYLKDGSYDDYVTCEIIGVMTYGDHRKETEEYYKKHNFYKASMGSFLISIESQMYYIFMDLSEGNVAKLSESSFKRTEDKQDYGYYDVLSLGGYYYVLKYPNAWIMCGGSGGHYALEYAYNAGREGKELYAGDLLIKACQEAANHDDGCDKNIDVINDFS